MRGSGPTRRSRAGDSGARLVARAPDLPPGVGPDGSEGRILTAALGLFAERGFYGTSIRDIARAVGIQSASLYGHFPSKEHILAALVLAGHEEHHRALETAVSAAPDNPAARLEAWVCAHVTTHARYPVLTVVANNELHVLPPELARPALDHRHASEILLLDIVEEGTAAGDFHPVHPWFATAAIAGMGIRVANWYDPSIGLGFEPADVADAYAEMALLMVRAAGATKRRRRSVDVAADEVLRRRGLRRTSAANGNGNGSTTRTKARSR